MEADAVSGAENDYVCGGGDAQTIWTNQSAVRAARREVLRAAASSAATSRDRRRILQRMNPSARRGHTRWGRGPGDGRNGHVAVASHPTFAVSSLVEYKGSG